MQAKHPLAIFSVSNSEMEHKEWDDDFFNEKSLPQITMETIIRHKRNTKSYGREKDPFLVYLSIAGVFIIFFLIIVAWALCRRFITGSWGPSSPQPLIGQNYTRETCELHPIFHRSNARQTDECKFTSFVPFIN